MPTTEAPRKIRLQLSPEAQRYVAADAPRDVRLMASRGALPLPPVELATVLFALMHDADPEVKATARDSLEGLPESICLAVLGGATHPAVLSHLARAFRDDEARVQKIALNPAADDDTIAFLAGRPFKSIVDIISNNQERLQRSNGIVDALGSNPLTGRAVIERILTFLGMEDAVPEEEDALLVSSDANLSDAEAEAALRAVLGDELAHLAPDLVHDSEEDGDVVLDDDVVDAGNLFAVVQNMSVMQKIKLARMGNKEARNLLVRDRNKIVALSAVSNPKMTITEIATIAKSRNVSDDILRVISRNREWTRDHQVKLGLATNPKCPPSQAMKFVNFLHDRELRAMMRSKDVTTAISTHARRVLMKRGKL